MKKRNLNLDLIRAIAIVNVIAVHYLVYTGYYGSPQVAITGMLFAILRCVFITCVPLFLILSGYLCKEKVLGKGYYQGIIRVLLSYLLVGLICQVAFVFLGKVSIKDAIISFFTFEAAPYGWYIGMYCGLFLLIPFINALWNSLNDSSKKILLVSMLVITALPCLLNGFDFSNSSFWQGTKSSHTQLMPEYFVGMYPMTYYFIGCYINENETIFQLNNKKRICVLLVSVILFGVINYIKNYNILFPWGLDTSYGSYQSIVIATLIFIILLNMSIKKPFMVKIITALSKYSLLMYLVSYLVDKAYYHCLLKIADTNILKLVFYFPSVIIIVLISLLVSIPLNMIVIKVSQLMTKKN